jgi:hypothetical protein
MNLDMAKTVRATSHYSDKDGPNAGVPYDGTDPKFSALYHDYSELKGIPPDKARVG